MTDRSVAHSPSHCSKAGSTLFRTLDPLMQDSSAFYQNHALFGDSRSVLPDTDEGARIAAALGERKAGTLKNHGIFLAGLGVEPDILTRALPG
ncbi:class II aldolase/adducin family protein [Paraburkholderia fungorum]|uniref:class II aldolase/adducin family protein n=1 Tax=Paraburkholderia fungorum TaxID=134537 RepID=UPI0038BDC344